MNENYMREDNRTEYEIMEAKMTAHIRDLEAQRAEKDKPGYANAPEHIKEYNITGKITTSILQYVCSVAADYNIMPVDMGYKLNNLTKMEFIAYAHDLVTYSYAHPAYRAKYDTKKDRDHQFYRLRDDNKCLVDDSTNIPASAYVPAKEYHIPTDTEISLRNDLEWMTLKVEHLADRLSNSADAYYFMKAILEDTEQKLTDTKEAWIQDLAWQHETGYISVDDAIADLAKDKAITALHKKYDYSPRTRK